MVSRPNTQKAELWTAPRATLQISQRPSPSGGDGLDDSEDLHRRAPNEIEGPKQRLLVAGIQLDVVAGRRARAEADCVRDDEGNRFCFCLAHGLRGLRS